MKKLLFSSLALACLASGAAIDRPDVRTFAGTGFYADGWYNYNVGVYSDKDSLLFQSTGPLVVSPRYASPVRKVVLQLRATQDAPTRYLRVSPYVNDVEADTNAFDCAVRRVKTHDVYEFVTFDFEESASVNAFRLGLDGSGNGNWRVAMICVAYGTKEADEDEQVRQFANELPAPADLRIAALGKTSLSVRADAVDGAVGYRFRLVRLDGAPQTELKEDFDLVADGLKLSDGWSLASENAKLSACTEDSNSSYADTKSSPVTRALKIEKGKQEAAPVRVEVVSPTVTAAVTGYSFASKRASSEGTNVMTVRGRAAHSETWQDLGEPFAMSTSMRTVQGTVDPALNIEQVKFVFTAESGASCRPCGLDSLRVVYGGNESREVIEDGTRVTDEPAYSTNGLATARYECQVQAVGGTLRDSSWSSPLAVDLEWADLKVSAPSGIVTSATGGKLTVSWEPIAGADHYLVDVVSADDPGLFALRSQKTSLTTLTVTVPSVGDYAVRVTAVSPGGLSSATSVETTGTVELDQLGEVKAEAVDRQSIVATWKTLPLAESYQAKLVRIGGETETVELGWPSEDGKIALPDGWSCHPEWGHDAWSSGSALYPRLPYTDCWIASADRGLPVTKLVCRYKCGKTAAATVDCTRFRVEVQEGASAVWKDVGENGVLTRLSELTQTFAVSSDVRRVRLSCASASARTMGDLALGKVTLTYGEESRVEEDSQSVAAGEVTFRNLDPAGRYRVVVAPQPSDDATSSSATIDLASERFRVTDAVALGSLKDGVYAEDFSSLSNQLSDVVVRKAELDCWQFFRGSGEAELLLYTAGTNRTTGGVYVFGSGEGVSPVRSLGTLATGSFGCSFGIAFRNDLTHSVPVESIAFDTVQRSFRTNPATYVLDWLVTDGVTGIGAEGDWRRLPVRETAPFAGRPPDGMSEYRQSVLLADGLPAEKIPPGGVLILRWRHEKVASGPMMAIDNVRIEFRTSRPGFLMVVQ